MRYPLQVMLMCVRWHAAYPLSLREIEEMIAERRVFVDHATAYRWAIKILPALAVVFGRRKRIVDTGWRMDETSSKQREGRWLALDVDHQIAESVLGPLANVAQPDHWPDEPLLILGKTYIT